MPKRWTWTCKQCYVSFESDRKDAHFCTPKCAAAYARIHGEFRTHFHAEKGAYNYETCAHCQTMFEYNDYAQRGGQRKAQYCSNKCRQAAYRARKGAAAGYTGHWDDARNDKRTEEEKRKQQQQQKKDTSQEQQQQQKKDTSQEQQQQQKKDTSQEWYMGDDYFKILGVTYLNTFAEAKRAYMKLVKLYHPDTNKSPEATVIMQRVNAAWDKIGKPKNFRV